MRRLATRLKSLETTPTAGLSIEARRLLVAILGRRDALFWPWRFPHYPAEVQQREYLSGSSGISAKASGSGQWKSAHEARSELVASGRAVGLHSGGQIVGLRLTPLGEAEARAMVGSRLRTLPEVWFIYSLWGTIDGAEIGGESWVSEAALFQLPANGAGDPSSWDYRTEAMLPLLVSGLFVAKCDTTSRICYRRVEGQAEPTPPPSSTVGFWEQADDIYVSAFDSERAVIEALRDSSGGISIPLPRGTGLEEITDAAI